MPPTSARKQAERDGRRAEHIAALFLRAKGYSLLDHRARTPLGEIDLIARRGGVLAFIEVKYRPGLEAALGAVSDQSWHRIARAADAWTSRRSQFQPLDRRYDLIAICPWRWPKHMRDFWRP